MPAPGRAWRLFARLFAIADRPITAARKLGSRRGLLVQAIVQEVQSPQIVPRRRMIAAAAEHYSSAVACQTIVVRMIGEIFARAERDSIQGASSAVWGLAAIVGLAISAFLV